MGLQYRVQTPKPEGVKLPSNYVSTTKYNLITFLPFSLILQFRRYANLYFLACAILQSIPLISPLSPLSAILPLIFVLSLSMAREGYQDYKRWKSDKQSNSSLTHLFKQNNVQKQAWSVIRPGDIVKVYRQELIPADMIPLYCSNQSGISYVQTSSLDGEKNLKPKISISQSQLMYNSKKKTFVSAVTGEIYCDEPNQLVGVFNGKIDLNIDQTVIKNEVNHKNLLLRGTKLKNTDWIVGLTIYTGKNTKIMMNGCSATSKTSNIERKVNKIILVIIVFQLLCCALSSIYCFTSCLQTTEFQNFIRNGGSVNCSQVSGISFGSYFILYSTYIPISLVVSLQFVKVFQGYAMSVDKQMHSPVTDRDMECHTVSINQQLGQIQYILTDKTGTLTCNKMQFKNIIVGNQLYGQDIKLHQVDKQFDYQNIARRYSKAHVLSPSSQDKYESPNSHFDSRGIAYELSIDSHSKSSVEKQLNFKEEQHDNEQDHQGLEHKKQIQLIFFIIATCHQCLREVKRPHSPASSYSSIQNTKKQEVGEGKQQTFYQGPSPDEVALLNAAKKIGFQFINTQNKVTTVIYRGNEERFNILKIIEFDSDRKRMTIAVQWRGKKMVFVKGADTSLKKILAPDQKYLQFLVEKTSQMAKTGLRSLWYGYKYMPNTTNFDSISVEDMEKGLTLIGASGIQDRLQDYVPQTIYSLKQGGIKFIMLTGDKLQTAENIARSCKMIQQAILIDKPEKLKEAVNVIKNGKNSSDQKICPVIDGSAINFNDNQQDLLQAISNSQSAVFCRVTPIQKAEIVKLVKKLGKLTLAIGDGANDVNMILEAHVGIGIFGQEGTRAAQVANYAIGQFCLLWKLLLYHGRLNYIRVAEMILYFFYKNMVFTIVQFAYSFYNLGSGQSFWLSWSITFYNMVFTLFPVVLRAVFEVDVEVQSNKKTLKQIKEGSIQNTVLYSYYPKMYIVGQKNQMFTGLLFLQWFSLGILQGVICLVITLYSMDGLTNSSGIDSYETGFYFAELSAYTSVIIVVTMKIAINVRHWNWILVIGFVIPSFGAYILYCVMLNLIPLSDTYYYFTQIIQMPSFYLANVLAVLGMFAGDLFMFSLQATKNNFQNYFKRRAMTGRRMTEINLQSLVQKMENKKSFLL